MIRFWRFVRLLLVRVPGTARLRRWCTFKEVDAIIRDKERQGIPRETTGTVTFSSANPWLGGAVDKDDWLEPTEDLAGNPRRYDA